MKGGGIHDIEAGGGSQLYPSMAEDPLFRWAFIRKVYAIISVQFILTAMVAAGVVYAPGLAEFFVGTTSGLVIYIIILISPFIIMCPLFAYRKHHPWNFILLALFTIAISFGKIVLEALILTSVVVVSLTLYTFWAARQGYDFSFLGPFLFAGMMVLLFFSLIQFFLPMGKLSVMIFGLLAALLFSTFIIYDTNNLIKNYSYDEYIAAAVALYMDIINLFLALLSILNAADS
ncbi:hypothetical protein V2J09_014201 [Rumex salicifolius]